jgi:hypothetical protein
MDQMQAASSIMGSHILQETTGSYLDSMLGDDEDTQNLVGFWTPSMWLLPMAEFLIVNAFRARRAIQDPNFNGKRTQCLDAALGTNRLTANASFVQARQSFEPRDWLNIIEACEPKDLQMLTSENVHHMALELRNLAAYGSDTKKRKKTIEYRHHAGTLDVNVALHWIKFVLRLTRHAHESTSASIRTLYLAVCDDPAPSLRDLLIRLGVDSATRDHYLAQANSSSPSASKRAVDMRARSENFGGSASPFHSTMLAAADEHEREYRPEMVEEAIRKKMEHAGYGLFSRTYLNALPWQSSADPLSPEQLDKITVGYQPPVDP